MAMFSPSVFYTFSYQFILYPNIPLNIESLEVVHTADF